MNNSIMKLKDPVESAPRITTEDRIKMARVMVRDYRSSGMAFNQINALGASLYGHGSPAYVVFQGAIMDVKQEEGA